MSMAGMILIPNLISKLNNNLFLHSVDFIALQVRIKTSHFMKIRQKILITSFAVNTMRYNCQILFANGQLEPELLFLHFKTTQIVAGP
jgi:hypothetical protein